MADKRMVCLNCMDGRVQLPVIQWIRDQYGADFVDMVTEAGMDGFLAGEQNSIQDVLRKVQMSIDRNKASNIFLVGHYDCRGNSVSDDQHRENIHSAVKRIKKEFSGMEVTGLWVNSRWQVERVAE